MLVLSRERDERVIIRCPSGESIEVAVCEILGRKVRLGFVAPASYVIDREEVDRAKKAAQGLDG